MWNLAEWHRSRFPWATDLHVGLKLAEEAGEVARWLVDGRGDLAEELADVVIVANVLASRSDIDLDSAVESKLRKIGAL